MIFLRLLSSKVVIFRAARPTKRTGGWVGECANVHFNFILLLHITIRFLIFLFQKNDSKFPKQSQNCALSFIHSIIRWYINTCKYHLRIFPWQFFCCLRSFPRSAFITLVDFCCYYHLHFPIILFIIFVTSFFLCTYGRLSAFRI